MNKRKHLTSILTGKSRLKNKDVLLSRSFSPQDDMDLSEKLINGINKQKFNSLLDAVYGCYGVRITHELSSTLPNFFIYEKDYLLEPHTDMYGRPSADMHVNGNNMCVSFVVYFNDTYEGGQLVVYRGDVDESLVKKDSFDYPSTEHPSVAARIRPAAGSIVAFPSTIFHKVEKITLGEKLICTMIMPHDGTGISK